MNNLSLLSEGFAPQLRSQPGLIQSVQVGVQAVKVGRIAADRLGVGTGNMKVSQIWS